MQIKSENRLRMTLAKLNLCAKRYMKYVRVTVNMVKPTFLFHDTAISFQIKKKVSNLLKENPFFEKLKFVCCNIHKINSYFHDNLNFNKLFSALRAFMFAVAW